ncbi:MAG TPA: ABC transporter substrate-binding protein [Candidatus Dependentiae bacterium]|nr:ABC transporter substrate-binding protein [Candidatus Dependentiae bacterium]
MYILYILICAFIPWCNMHCNSVPDIFDSIQKIESYAASTEENPKPDFLDWENPEFSTYLNKQKPSFLKKTLYSLRLLKPLWNLDDCTKLLNTVTTDREYNGYQAPFVQKLEPAVGSSFIILGELFGAFHSLARDLRSLEQQKILDEHMKIIEPDCYIVINGNSASRSAYALETLTVIARLLYVNPDNVFVTIGTQEENGQWQQYSLKHQLMILAPETSKSKKIIERFFNTLPSALYLIADRAATNISVVRISNVGQSNKNFSENFLGDFFNHPEQDIYKIDPAVKEQSTIDINLKALICAEPYLRTRYIKSQGLHSIGKEEGAPAWAVMSSPIQSSQELFNFYYDAYAIMLTAQSPENWTLTLYNSDVRENEPIKQRITVKLLSGQELTPQESIRAHIKILNERKAALEHEFITLNAAISGKEPSEIKPATESIETQTKAQGVIPFTIPTIKDIPLGKSPDILSVATIIDLSGLTKQEGESIETGINLIFDYFNKNKAPTDVTYKLITVDSRYNKEYARKAVLQLLEKEHTGLILLPLSTLTLEGYLDLIQDKQILVLFPAASGRTNMTNLSNLIFLRASGAQEAATVTNYIAHDLGGKKFAFFYTNDTFGQESLKSAQETLKKLNIEDSIALPFDTSSLNFTEQVRRIKEFKADSLGLFVVQTAAKELLHQLGTEWLINKNIFGTQDLSLKSFRKYCDRNRLKFICTSVVPNPDGPLTAAQNFRFLAEGKVISHELYAFEAFLSAAFFGNVTRSISKPITAAKIIDFIEQVQDYSLSGLRLTFDPKTRQLLQSIWLITHDNEWKEIKLQNK